MYCSNNSNITSSNNSNNGTRSGKVNLCNAVNIYLVMHLRALNAFAVGCLRRVSLSSNVGMFLVTIRLVDSSRRYSSPPNTNVISASEYGLAFFSKYIRILVRAPHPPPPS